MAARRHDAFDFQAIILAAFGPATIAALALGGFVRESATKSASISCDIKYKYTLIL